MKAEREAKRKRREAMEAKSEAERLQKETERTNQSIEKDSKQRQREAEETARFAKIEAEKAFKRLKLIIEKVYVVTTEITTAEELEGATIYMLEKRRLEREVQHTCATRIMILKMLLAHWATTRSREN